MAIYLDYNATAPVRPEAIEAMNAALLAGGNASSVHAAGRAARARIETARRQVALLAGTVPAAVTFLSGGAEANDLSLKSAKASGVTRIIIGATEHDTVVETAASLGLPVETWPVDGEGVADLAWLEERLAHTGKALVCLMLANNETGVIQPVAEAAALVHAAGGFLHVDAVQAAGKIAIAWETMGADTLSLSAHKIGGPQGVGALIAGPRARLTRQVHGGGQERGVRAGTENLPGIAGFGAAARAALSDLPRMAAQAGWRHELEAALTECGSQVLGAKAPRLPQTLCVATPGHSSELQVIALDLAGVMVSAGSACSSGKVKTSRVVAAMGRPDLAAFSLRISGGWASTASDWRAFAEAWADIQMRRQARQPQFA